MIRNSRLFSIDYFNTLLDHGLLLGLAGQGVGGGADDHGLGSNDSVAFAGLTVDNLNLNGNTITSDQSAILFGKMIQPSTSGLDIGNAIDRWDELYLSSLSIVGNAITDTTGTISFYDEDIIAQRARFQAGSDQLTLRNNAAGNKDVDFSVDNSGNLDISVGSGTQISITAANLTMGAGTITSTSFIIGGNTLDTNEWAYLDGLDQALKTSDSPTFVGLTTTGSVLHTLPDAAEAFYINGLTSEGGNSYTISGNDPQILIDSGLTGTVTAAQLYDNIFYNCQSDAGFSGDAQDCTYVAQRILCQNHGSFTFTGGRNPKTVTTTGLRAEVRAGSSATITSNGQDLTYDVFGGDFIAKNAADFAETADTLVANFYGGRFATQAPGASPEVTAGDLTVNCYGGYFDGTMVDLVEAGGTLTTTCYGGYFTASGGDTNYGIYSAAGLNYLAGVTTITGVADGGRTNYDLKVGDTTTPDYGMIQFGDAVIGRTSYKSGSIDLDGTILIQNIGGPVTSQVEFCFAESTGNSTRFALAKSGAGNATYNPRSMLIAGPAPTDTDFVKVSYWQTNNSIFDNLACDVAGDGADLGVQNDLEVEGDIFVDSIKESTSGAGVTFADETLFSDKVKFTQTDGNEFIDSLNDGYMDYGATTGHRFNANVNITGGFTVSGEALFSNKVKFTQVDGNEYIDSLADGYLDYSVTTAHRFNMSTANTDVRLEFIGTTNSGLLEWMEDEDYFKFGDEVRLTDKLSFTQEDSNEFIDSLGDGYMDYGATTAHRFNATVNVTGAATVSTTLEVTGETLLSDKLKFTQVDGNEYIDSLNDAYMDYGATSGHRFNTTDLAIDTANNTVGINMAASNSATLSIDQSNNAAVRAVLMLDQADVSEECIECRSDGVDRDINILTVNVTGTPKLSWDESEDEFALNKGLNVTGVGTFSDNIVLPKTSSNGIKVDTTTPTFGFADLLGEPAVKNTGGSRPALVVYRDGLFQFEFAAGEEEYFDYHIPHDYVKGTDIFLHFHWSTNGALVNGGTITFDYEISYAKAHAQAAFPASVSGTIVSATASSTQYTQELTEVQISASTPSGSQIDTDDLEPDGVIICTAGLNANNLTVSGGAVPDPFIHYIDIHYQTTGLIGTKAKAPDFYA